MALGDYIRNQRLPHVSMRQLARDIGVSASYLSDVENDRRKISYQMAMRIAVALHKYVGGQVHHAFDVVLMLAGLLTAERDCLCRLWEMSGGDYPKNTTLYNYRGEIYEALYGELDRYINGDDEPNMFCQQQALS
jgi:transcriptional regulator with XRE-family HTH domain